MAHTPLRLRQDFLKTLIFGLVLTIAGFLLAYQFVDPAPPKTLRIQTGSEQGAYHRFALQYQEILARDGITLELISSQGSLANLKALGEGKADLAFVQGGTAAGVDNDAFHSLGSITYEPLWIFHNHPQKKPTQLTQWSGYRLAVGAKDSGTRSLVNTLLDANGLNENQSPRLTLGGTQAVEALLNNQVDVLFMVASAQSPTVARLLQEPGIQLMSLQRSRAYTRRFNYLSEVLLPEGLLDLQNNLPAEDVHLIAPTANLVALKDTHPALVDLLMKAMAETHGQATWFQNNAEFPQPNFLEFDLHPTAEHFYQYGPSLLQRWMPFWASTLVDRLKIMLLPLLALLLPLMRLMPPLYQWRIRRRIYRWYEDLLMLEHTDDERSTDERLKALNKLEQEVRQVQVPLPYNQELYHLRTHIEQTQQRLQAGTCTDKENNQG